MQVNMPYIDPMAGDFVGICFKGMYILNRMGDSVGGGYPYLILFQVFCSFYHR